LRGKQAMAKSSVVSLPEPKRKARRGWRMKKRDEEMKRKWEKRIMRKPRSDTGLLKTCVGSGKWIPSFELRREYTVALGWLLYENNHSKAASTGVSHR